MAVDFKVPHQRTAEYLIEPKHLTVRPEVNGRHDVPDIEEIIKSLAAIGQLSPILIGSDGGIPLVIDGHTRWRAAVEGIKRGVLPKEFRLRCVYFKGTAVEQFQACVAANHERNASTPTDDAHNIAKFERFGMTHDQIAEFYHEDTRWVRDRLALIQLSDESREAVKSGKVPKNAVQVLAKLSKEQQSEAVRADKVTAASVKAVGKVAVKVKPSESAGALGRIAFESYSAKTGDTSGVPWETVGVPWENLAPSSRAVWGYVAESVRLALKKR